ncbi:MAG: hypothetical protein ACK559_21600, partial [bacterium]
YIPAGFYMQLMPRSSSFKLNLYLHHGVIDNDFNSTIKLLVRNTDSAVIQLKPGTFLAQGLIVPVVHPHLHEVQSIDICSSRGDGMMGSSDNQPTSLTLKVTPLSPLPALLAQRTPTTYNVPGLNTV